MSKIVFLGDTHFGVRGDSLKFHAYMKKFYHEVLFPYMQENNIKVIYQLGDLFDRRKFINFNTLAECKEYFFDELKARGIQLITLLGNHDIFWKESLSVNAQSLILGEYDNITIIDKPTRMHEDNASIDLIPWICKENEDEVSEFVNNSKSDLCVGHFEFAGFPMYKGMVSEHGISKDAFAKYERVLSGHYHTRSKEENIEYIGTPYEMTWQDAYDPKGFAVFDTETRQLQLIDNPLTIHEKIMYDDKEKDPIDLKNINIKDKYVKLVVVNKTDLYKFDRFVTQLYTKEAHEIKIIEDMSEFTEGSIDSDINLEDTLSILGDYIDSVETEGNKEDIKTFVKSLYIEAMNLEVV
jgi:DNA repair exonuclease SbcCD nuclease subunit